ncbi:LuxR C-terminal-related transcriptional regulator [Kineococcus sp. SYSU DK001]|uniref:LuxR C-terminal-related transcriptional regulator n=1 Tax=Kineococcus sp. SYSU DK001 TaxID=3383122 RepID=UPI003D7DA689
MAPTHPAAPAGPPPLRGRDRELARIASILTDGGDPLVVGPRGSGRTAVLHAALQPHRDRGELVVPLVALRPDATVPLALVVQLVSRLPSAARTHPATRAATALHRALERLVDRAHDLAGGPGGDADHRTLTRDVVDVVAELGRAVPAVLAVDDLDHADPGSRDVVAAVAAARAATGVPVLATAEPAEPAEPATPVAAAWTPVPLPALSRRAAGEVLDGLGVAPDPGVRAPLLRFAAGNPLVLVELARRNALDDAGTSAAGGPGRGPHVGRGTRITHPRTTVRLRDAFTAGLRDLPGATRRALVLLALAGESEQRAVVRAARRSEPGTVWEPAARAGVLHRDGPGFAHPVGALAVLEDSTLHQRVTAHRALAAALPAGHPARAWHAARAGGPADPAAAAGLAAELAGTAGRLAVAGAPGAAAHVLTVAAGVDDDRRRSHHLVQAARLARAAGDPRWSERLSAAAATSQLSADGTPSAGDLDALLKVAGEAWVSGDPAVLGRAHRLLDGAATATPAHAAVRAWGRHLLDPVGRAASIAAALAGGTDLLAALRSTPISEAAALGGLALVTDEAERAARLYAEALRRSPRAVPGEGGGIPELLVLALIETGRWDEAAARTARSLREAPAGTRPSSLTSRAVLALLRAEDDADAHVLAAARLLSPAASGLHLARLLFARGLAAAAAGEHRLAARFLAQLWRPDGEPLHPMVCGLATADAVAAHLAGGEPDRARALLTRARARPDVPSARRGFVLHRAGALLSEDPVELHALALAPGSERWPLAHAQTLLEQGEWLRRHQRRAQARVPLRAAVSTFERLGAVAWAHRARQELAATGPADEAGDRRAPGAGAGPLTSRQQAVAELAAAGLTNPQIAERLRISSRTVQTHLAHAFRALGVQRRAQLAEQLRHRA